MKEYLLLIKTDGDHLAKMSAEEQQKHVQKISNYIGKLMQDGKLKGAQPLETKGTMVYGTKGIIKDGPFNESKELICGYFHILANDLEDAIAIAKRNPILEDAEAIIEVRPIKSMEGIS